MFKKILVINLFILTSIVFSQDLDTINIQKKSPWNAVLKSALLPGLGQIYNQSYWKVPVIWGFIGWFGYNVWLNDKQYKDYRNLYQLSIEQGQENFIYKRIREFYRDQRDLFAIYLGLTYFLNLVDAYVDAHLFNFDVLSKNNEIRFKFVVRF